MDLSLKRSFEWLLCSCVAGFMSWSRRAPERPSARVEEEWTTIDKKKKTEVATHVSAPSRRGRGGSSSGDSRRGGGGGVGECSAGMACVCV